jgi:hypothetical protein
MTKGRGGHRGCWRKSKGISSSSNLATTLTMSDGVLAVPPGMRQTLIGWGLRVLLVRAHQATPGERYGWNAQSCASHTGQRAFYHSILLIPRSLLRRVFIGIKAF